ncbi:UNVERIFIED_CONTAM: hypothetical protein Slati_0183500 [Sesamum latifolium]|uniref:Uncharacterized protein n=1 Tax=Sesamum latifolium TaxID=2727402 RepID=A0AAW2YB57_9LAMI
MENTIVGGKVGHHGKEAQHTVGEVHSHLDNIVHPPPNRMVLLDMALTDIHLTFVALGLKFKPASRRGRPRKSHRSITSGTKKRGPGITLIEVEARETHDSKRRCQLVDKECSLVLAGAASYSRQQL